MFPQNDSSLRNGKDLEVADFQTKLVSNPTTLIPCPFPAMEMLLSNEPCDMKLMNFHDSLEAHDETGSKCSIESPASTKNESSSVFSLNAKSDLSEAPSKMTDDSSKLEVNILHRNLKISVP